MPDQPPTKTLPALPAGFTSPEYDDPPVVETALTVQFTPVAGFKSVHIGRFHKLIEADFPQAQDQTRAGRIVEHFPPRERQVAVEFAGVLIPRVWFEAAEESRDLLQLQPDRLSYNWRRSEEPYPRYSQSKERFGRYYDLFLRFCADEGLPDVQPDLCEVVYVNRLVPHEGRETAAQLLRKALKIEASEQESCLPAPEGITFNRAYEIGEAAGRLYAEATVAREDTGEEFVAVKLTARVKCADGISVADAMQHAHDWAVNGFANVVDRELQDKRLGRTQ